MTKTFLSYMSYNAEIPCNWLSSSLGGALANLVWDKIKKKKKLPPLSIEIYSISEKLVFQGANSVLPVFILFRKRHRVQESN